MPRALLALSLMTIFTVALGLDCYTYELWDQSGNGGNRACVVETPGERNSQTCSANVNSCFRMWATNGDTAGRPVTCMIVAGCAEGEWDTQEGEKIDVSSCETMKADIKDKHGLQRSDCALCEQDLCNDAGRRVVQPVLALFFAAVIVTLSFWN
eukprot:CAMPEP_0196717276 /NCGR_PEP_ID=MMETSP1091-20130531/664_1 /TAXON_ID=302021 /ORGANISM="Rhodomonas sp., Strain CCMP768" /LENGTH=153 /DNA_ID=CAMNT_0042057545 /DNA_START=35 /DNA_END=496 /DNA_ORIENTATION=+